MRPSAEVDDTDFRISYHARLRYMMRIDRVNSLKSENVENSRKITLPEKYVKGLWNPEKAAHFLVKGTTIATVIPSDLQGEDLTEEEVEKCESDDCNAVIHPEYDGKTCGWCGEEV